METKELATHWNKHSQAYSELIQKEIKEGLDIKWKEEIESHYPQREKLNILDVGTGPGFFPIILSGENINVLGIDITENMIEEAKKNFELANVNAKALIMDSQDIDFEDETFDMIICRNLTWTLDKPKKAYKEWFRILKKDGILLVYDGSWYSHYYHENYMNRFKKMRNLAKEKYDVEVYDYAHATNDEEKRLKDDLYLSNKIRPSWDVENLIDVGFTEINIEMDYLDRIEGKEERLKKGDITRTFMIKAKK